MGGKQADRANKKKVAAQDDAEPEATMEGGSFVDLLKVLFLGSSIMMVAPKLQAVMTDDSKEKAPAKKAEEKEEVAEGEVAEAKAAEESLEYADSIFAFLKKRLVWHNCLGLSSPATEEESLAAWMDLKTLELDWGPRPKRNKSPGLDRMKVNLFNNMPQYLHLLLALMMLRALLFRSWFACLPWLVGYQFLSLWVPLDGIPQLPQVPVEKCPLKFRVAASAGIHALMWLFFAYEVLWGMWFFEKGMVAGLFAYHSYAVRPAEKAAAKAQ